MVLNMIYIPNAMKFGFQSRSNLLIINMIFEIVDLDLKLNTLGRFGLKIALCLIFMKFSTQNKSDMLIMYIYIYIYILIEIGDLDPKL